MIPEQFLVPYLISNVVALGILAFAFGRPSWVRWFWVAIFAWAGLVNTRTVAAQPHVYLAYAALTPSDLYRAFIEGWFREHIALMVQAIAVGQVIIAILLSQDRPARRVGIAGATAFLLAIAPLGVGSAFPFSLIAIGSLVVMERRLCGRDRRVPSLAGRFIPSPIASEVHEAVIRAPADVVFETAAQVDLHRLPVVRTIFAIRRWLMRDTAPAPAARGLVAETRALGWGVLVYAPGRRLVMGAAAQPWTRNVTFRSVPPEGFLAFNEPNLVKIVWTLEAEPLSATTTWFRTETRVEATDAAAAAHFRWYWLAFGPGVRVIRWTLVRVLARTAERRYRAARAQPLRQRLSRVAP